MSTDLKPRLGTALNEGTLGLLGVAILLVTLVLWTAQGPNVEKTDFALTYVGAHIVHDGAGSRLYDPNLQIQLRDSMFQHPSPLFFEHPPFEALALAPLAAFPFRISFLIWGLLNTALVLVLMVWLRRFLIWPAEDLGYLALWLSFAPLIVALYQGQSSILVLAAFAISFVQLKNEKPLLAGAVFGVALLKFQFALPMALIFLIRKQWRFVAGLAGTAVALFLLSVAAVGWHGMISYVQFLARIGSNPHDVSYGSAVDMPTLHGLVYAIGGSQLSAILLSVLVALLSIALLGWIATRWKTLEEKGADPIFAAGIGGSLLSGAHMFTHDFSPLLVGMFLMGGALNSTNRGLKTTAKLTLVIFWTFPLYFLFVKWHCLYLMAVILLVFTWCSVRLATSTSRKRNQEFHPATAD